MTTQTFTTPGNHSFTVPSGVKRVYAKVWGAQGADSSNFSGGKGGYAEGFILVTAGNTLDVNVGAQGTGWDGGEASDVRQDGTSLSDRVLVGAGGGGAGNAANGGGGGPDTGATGGNSSESSGHQAFGGTGGTQSAGGSGGNYDSNDDGAFGQDGGQPSGGDPVSDSFSGESATSGGGGDGYYGGGSGGVTLDNDFADSAGGGGGSNFITSNAIVTQSSTRGVQAGDGKVELEYEKAPSVTIDSLTETGEKEVRVQASSSTPYLTSGEWQVYRSTDGSRGPLVHVDKSDGDLDWTDTNAPAGKLTYYTATRVSDYGVDSPQSSVKVKVATVSGIAIAAAEDDEIEVSWDKAEGAGSYEILRAGSSGASYSDYTQVHNTSGGGDTTSWVDTSVTSGTTYYYTIRGEANADTDYDSRYPGEVSGTATLLPPIITDSYAEFPTSIIVEFTLQDNNSQGDVDIIVDGTVFATVGVGASSYGITGLTEGTSYDIEVRRNTPDATATSAVDTQHTKPLAATDVSVDSISGDDATISWTDESANNDKYIVIGEVGGSTRALKEVGASDTSTTVTLTRPNTYNLKLRAVSGTDDNSAQNDSTGAELTLAPHQKRTGGEGWYVEVDHGNGSTLTANVVGEPQKDPRANGLPRVKIPVEKDEKWLSPVFDEAPMRVWEDNQRLPIEEVENVQMREDATIIEGVGGVELKREVSREYTDTEINVAVEEMISEITSYEPNVDDPTSTTSSDTRIQDASNPSDMENNMAEGVADTDPVVQTLNGLKLGQTFYWGINDGGDAVRGTNGTEVSDGTLFDRNWEDADAIELNSSGEYIEFDFDLDYEIPSGEVGTATRWEFASTGADNNMRLLIDGSVVWDFNVGGPESTDWNSLGSYSGSLSAGTHTVRLEADGTMGDSVWVDAICLFDERFHDDVSNFPNQIITDDDDTGYLYLPGPPKYGTSHSLETDDATPPLSIAGGKLEVTMSDTSGQQALALSPDAGGTFPVSESNTLSVSGSFASLSSRLRGRITLSPFGDGASETPSDGARGQEMTAYDLFADLDDTPVISDSEFDDNLLEVLQGLASNLADSIFEVQYDDTDGFTFEWTQPGQRQKTSGASVARYTINRSRRDSVDKVTVKGTATSVSGERFTSDHDTAVSLNNGKILEFSETVYNTSNGTIYEKGVDYTMTWADGEITVLSSGSMSDSTEYAIDYRWKPIGIAETSTAGSNPRAKTFNISGLSTDRECEIAARRIRNQVQGPLWLVEVTIPKEEAGFSVINEISLSELPEEGPYEIKTISEKPGSLVLNLGSRDSLSGAVQQVQSRVASNASRI